MCQYQKEQKKNHRRTATNQQSRRRKRNYNLDTEILNNQEKKIERINKLLAMNLGHIDGLGTRMKEFKAETNNHISEIIGAIEQIYFEYNQVMPYASRLETFDDALGPYVDIMNRISKTIDDSFRDFNKKINTMNSIVKDLDDIAKDPTISRTIEDLKEISGRF